MICSRIFFPVIPTTPYGKRLGKTEWVGELGVGKYDLLADLFSRFTADGSERSGKRRGL